MAANATEWQDLAAPGRFASCVRESYAEVYGYVALLAGHDRGAAEDLVRALYTALEREVRAGKVESMSLGRLRTGARRLWVQRHAAQAVAAAPGVADAPRVSTVADLSDAERAVAVFRYVNRMPATAVADELGLDVRMVDALDARALRRLGAAGGSTRLREFWGDTVVPRDGIVDELAPPEPEPEPPPVDENIDGHDHGHDGPAEVEGVVGADDEIALADLATADAPAADDGDVESHVDETAEHETADHETVHETAEHETVHETAAHETAEHEAIEIDTGAVAPPTDEGPARRHSRGHTVVVAVTVLLAVGAVIAAAVLWLDSRDNADSTAAPTTLPLSTTSPATTTPTTTEAPRPLVGFDPVCAEQPAARTPPPTLDEATLDTFGPLGASPNLTIDLPDSNSAGVAGAAAATVVRVAGGVVATVTADPAAPFEGAIVARVDADGTTRWVRCLETSAAVRSASGAVIADSLALGVGGAWTALSPDDGSAGAALPAEPAPAPTAPYGDPGTTATWPDPALSTIPGEAFTAATTGTVTVVLGCLVAPTATGCDQPVLRGYGAADAALLWERVGVSDVAVVRSGFAIIRYEAPGAGPAWYMINAGDGTAVEGQVWPADSFSGAFASVHGGVVADVVGGVLSVWYPSASGLAAVSLTLP